MFVRILLTELRRRGWSAMPLVDEGLIDAAAVTAPNGTISPEAWGRILLRAQELTRDPTFGLAFGVGASPSMLHTVGPLIGACRTLRESIDAFQRYQPLLSANTTWELVEHGDSAQLRCVDGLEDPLARRTSLEATLAFGYALGRQLVAEGSDEVWFQHDAPAYARLYSRAFPCPVRFGKEHNALVFARRLLDQRLPHADLALYEVLERHAALLLDERGGPCVSSRVRALLRTEPDLRHVCASYVAERLNTKTRSLRRALAAEHMTLSALLIEAQAATAKKALASGLVSIKEVAHELGYSEASAFHRAFKRWTGMTPIQFVREAAKSTLAERGRARAAHDVRSPGALSLRY